MIQEEPNQPTILPPAHIIDKAYEVLEFMTRDGHGRYWCVGGIASRALVEQLKSELAAAKADIAKYREDFREQEKRIQKAHKELAQITAKVNIKRELLSRTVAERDQLRAEVEKWKKDQENTQYLWLEDVKRLRARVADLERASDAWGKAESEAKLEASRLHFRNIELEADKARLERIFVGVGMRHTSDRSSYVWTVSATEIPEGTILYVPRAAINAARHP